MMLILDRSYMTKAGLLVRPHTKEPLVYSITVIHSIHPACCSLEKNQVSRNQ